MIDSSRLRAVTMISSGALTALFCFALCAMAGIAIAIANSDTPAVAAILKAALFLVVII
jgi:hypothetical protein